MSMPFSIEVEGVQCGSIFSLIFKRLKEIEKEFSPFLPDSKVSLYNQNPLVLKSASDDFKTAFIECRKYEKLTNGYFSAFFSKTYNPSGFIKGWSIEQISQIIKSKGYQNFMINGGGDVFVSSDGKKVWKIGIRDPNNKTGFIAKIKAKNLAVATSGNYERGKHIFNPKTGRPADNLLSVTVLGPEITKADIFATTIFAGGNYLEKDYRAIVLDKKEALNS